eukprot:gene9592-19941_t
MIYLGRRPVKVTLVQFSTASNRPLTPVGKLSGFFSRNRQPLINFIGVNIVLMIAINNYNSKAIREQREAEFRTMSQIYDSLKQITNDDEWLTQAEERVISKKSTLKSELNHILDNCSRRKDEELNIVKPPIVISKEIGTMIPVDNKKSIRIV